MWKWSGRSGSTFRCFRISACSVPIRTFGTALSDPVRASRTGPYSRAKRGPRRSPQRITNLYVWSSSPQDLLRKLPELDRLDCRWAVGAAAAANLYAPTLSSDPDPAVWVDARQRI